MATVRIELEPAFVLHQRAYRDTSVIVDVLTANHGRIGLVATGARIDACCHGTLEDPGLCRLY